MSEWPKIPKGLLGPNRDGLADPDALTPEQRTRGDRARLDQERDRRESRSPFVRALQAAADRALGRGPKGA
jgi:hypothetical protein